MQQMVNDHSAGLLTLERDVAERDLERVLVIHIERFRLSSHRLTGARRSRGG